MTQDSRSVHGPVGRWWGGALLLGAALLASLTGWTPAEAATVAEVRTQMGSRFEITAVASDEEVARQAIGRAYDEIERIEAMISSWRPTSETSTVNRRAGVGPTEVSPELYGLIRRSLKLSALTDGAFDVTFAGVGSLWDFDDPTPTLPEPAAIRAALEHVGYQKVALDPESRSVFLDDSGARIGFGAIGKGYAANRAVWVLKQEGITAGVVNAGGDLVAYGQQENGSQWEIGIAHPRDRDRIFARLPLTEQAVVTSGDYESLFEIDGKRYAHILDPRTGWPVDHLASVTIVCPDAELADGLATAVSVMGPDAGLALVDRLTGIEALVVDLEGRVRVSAGLRSQLIALDPTVLADQGLSLDPATPPNPAPSTGGTTLEK